MKKYYIFSGIIFLTLLVFLSFREYKSNYYEISVEDAYAVLATSGINISEEDLHSADPDLLKLNIVRDPSDADVFLEENNQITTAPASLLNSKLLKRLRNHEGTIVIVCEDIRLSARAWLILTRKGISNLKIPDATDNETLRYTFHPEPN